MSILFFCGSEEITVKFLKIAVSFFQCCYDTDVGKVPEIVLQMVKKEEKKNKKKLHGVYLLRAKESAATYRGYTPNIAQRIRAHHGEIRGGAKATSGKEWNVICFIWPFETKSEALKFEWAWKRRWLKQIERRRMIQKTTKRRGGLQSALEKMTQLFCMPKWVRAIRPTREMPPLTVSWMNQDPRQDKYWMYTQQKYRDLFQVKVKNIFDFKSAQDIQTHAEKTLFQNPRELN